MKAGYMRHAAKVCEFLRSYREPLFVRHEREELLERLAGSDDPELRKQGDIIAHAAVNGHPCFK